MSKTGVKKGFSKVNLARKYRDKWGMKIATKSLARVMYNENKLVFKDVEDARTILRSIEGKAGHRVLVTHPTPERPKNPYNLPESYQEKREPFILPKECNNILVISDLHIPYHDIDAITIALNHGKENNVNTIFINGDLIDNHNLSKFEKDPTKRSVKQEFDATDDFLTILRKEFPKAKIFWLKGNHCIRWERFLIQKVPEIWGDNYYTLEARLSLDKKKITLIDDKVLVKAGKLSITHGHHLFKGIFVPVSPARGAFNRAKQSVLASHLHRASHHPEVDLDGKVISCWTTACLCELRPNYSPLVSNSQHGFARVVVGANGNYRVFNYQIVDGEIY